MIDLAQYIATSASGCYDCKIRKCIIHPAAIIALARKWGEYVIGEDEGPCWAGLSADRRIELLTRDALRATQRKRNGE